MYSKKGVIIWKTAVCISTQDIIPKILITLLKEKKEVSVHGVSLCIMSYGILLYQCYQSMIFLQVRNLPVWNLIKDEVHLKPTIQHCEVSEVIFNNNFQHCEFSSIG